MSAPLTANQIVAGCIEWGIRYFEYPGWRTRGRPGPWGTLHGLVVHHTGSESQTDGYLEFLFETGRPKEGIPGPLCQWSIDGDGDLHLGAIGRANHAGKGSSVTLNHVIKEDYSYKTRNLTPGEDNIDGNAVYGGTECRYDGSHPMSAKMRVTLVKFYAMYCTKMGWTAASVIGHDEHTLRKNDPGHEEMYELRRDIDAAIKIGPTWPNLPSSGGTSDVEDDLSGFTADQLSKMMYNANALYGANLWAAPTGTGTALIATVNGIAKAVGILSTKLDAIQKQITDEDVQDDAALAAATQEIEDGLAQLKAAVELMQQEVQDVPKAS
jgi:hypothetical protein